MKNELKAFLKKHEKEILIAGIGIGVAVALYIAYKKGRASVFKRIIGYYYNKKDVLRHVSTPKNPFHLCENTLISTSDRTFAVMTKTGLTTNVSYLGEFGKWLKDHYAIDDELVSMLVIAKGV